MRDGSAPAEEPLAQRIAWARAEDGRINITITKADGTPQSLTGTAIVFAVRPRRTIGAADGLPLISRQAVIDNAAAGLAHFAVTSGDTNALTERKAYRYDVQLTDTTGARWQIVTESEFYLNPIVSFPGDQVTVLPPSVPLTPGVGPGTVTDVEVAAANKDGAANVPSMRTLGTGALQAAAGNDSRLSDARFPTTQAGWDATLVRYYLLDYDGGSDANVGYVDAAAGATIDPAGKALKTVERLMEIFPTTGGGRSVVVMQKLRAGGANYLKKDGATQDSINTSALVGYSMLWRGSTDLTNSAEDKVRIGFMTAVAGPNGDGSFTCAGGGTSSVFSVAAGSLGAEPAAIQYRVRFDANTATASLRNICRLITAHTTTQLTTTAFPATPSASDTFFVERPGVRMDKLFHTSMSMMAVTPTPAQATAGINGCQFVGLAFTSTTSGQVQLTGSSLNISGCELTGATNNFVMTATNIYRLSVGGNGYSDEGGSFRTHAMGFRTASPITITRCMFVNMTDAGLMNTAQASSISLCSTGIYGVKSYFATRPLVFFCGFPSSRTENNFAQTAAFQVGDAVTSNPAPRMEKGLDITGSNVCVRRVDFANCTSPCITLLGVGMQLFIDGCTGSSGNTNVGLDATGARNCTLTMGLTNANAFTGTAGDIRAVGPAVTTHAGLLTTNLRDSAGNHYLGTGGEVVGPCTMLTNSEGTALAIGALMRGSSASAVLRAQADTVANAGGASGAPLWVAVTAAGAGVAGYFVAAGVAQKWVLHDAAPTDRALSYVSVGTTGTATTTIPPSAATNQKLRLGHVAKVSGSLGLVIGAPDLFPVAADGLF